MTTESTTIKKQQITRLVAIPINNLFYGIYQFVFFIYIQAKAPNLKVSLPKIMV